jgi:hypothetical protein
LTAGRKLGLDDIADQREYERERPEFQQKVFATKRLRRVPVGPIMTLVFENALTIRYQVQEMARVEHLRTDEQIAEELRVYNPLIPDPGELSATLFLELTDEAALREWLPKLVGIERSILLGLRDPASIDGRLWVRCTPEESHAEQLTRETVTASVHYIRFSLSDSEVDLFASGDVVLRSDHPAYEVTAEMPDATRDELMTDLRD